ncbi:ABC transporter ATP-binding protein [Bombiscardovia coagulans]|uniref:ABC transporter n=1 Tax=Bombiscardovia coagulans TaxID=686666 RepID=A0A261ETR3_9BIFI|nr:ABC transporter ATP-binding protein [Bombiscardovia coagulans]OZG50249.1 ABC transporter [Bombiscardovia coagulans]
MYVQVSELSKTIKNRPVLQDVNADFDKGRIYGVVGPNGSGKTMLLRAICGFIRPTQGRITIDGKLVEFNRKLPENVGAIIETPGFVDSETGMQNLKYLAGINQAFDEEETHRLLTVFGLDEHRDKKVKSYSLGMRQKLAIVQALMEHQNLILLDEPTNGLDQDSVSQFLNEMDHQRDLGKTIIVATHHSDELHKIADEIYSMHDGILQH